MTHAVRRAVVALIAALILLPTPGAAVAKDYILTIGGGPSPASNQVSLEKNVVYFRRMLGDLGMTDVQHDVLFSDGDSPDRDVQFVDPAAKLPRINVLLAIVYNDEGGLHNQYRTNSLTDVRGPSDRQNLDRWFNDVGSHLAAGDRLIVYMTGHGGKGKPAANPHFYQWNNQTVSVHDFVERLDKISPDVQVVLVMVQCFSGGFANVIFKDGDPGKGLSDRAANRCGFFATVQERPAAGCTPDINEDNYHEYSTYFWSAIYGRTRTGQSVEPPDYDHDGRISFAEAHAFTMIHSQTIDFCVKTSDAFLRKFSRTEDKKIKDLLTAESDYDKLLAAASPIDKAVLDALSKELDLKGSNRTDAARKLANDIDGQRKRLGGEHGRLRKRYDDARAQIRQALQRRWPELQSRWHPLITEQLADQADEMVKTIEQHPRFGEMISLRPQMRDNSQKSQGLERRWVKCQRFIRLAETVALAANLPKVADPDIQKRYESLVAEERDTLIHTPAKPAPAGE